MVFGPINLAAQFYPAKTYFIADGLPSNAIYDVVQADNSVMWFVTSKGVTTYDAHEWHVFPDSLQLPTYLNTKIRKSKDGLIWLAGKNDTEFVIKAFDSGKWKSFPVPDSWQKNQSAFSFEIIGSGVNQQILLARNKEVHLYSADEWQNLTFPGESYFEINSIVHIGGDTFINTRGGQFVLAGDRLMRSEYDSLFRDLKDILTITKKEDILYILGFNWLAKVEDNELVVLSDELGLRFRSPFKRHSLIIDERDRIFFSSNSRVLQYLKASGEVRPLEVNGRSNNILSNKLYLDSENNIWSVDNRGLFKFNVLNFRSYNRDSGLAENEVSAIFESSDGNLYVANSSHLNVLRDGKVIKQVAIPTNEDKPVRILQIAEAEDGSLFLAGGAGGLYRFADGELQAVFGNEGRRVVTGVISYKDTIYFSDSEFIYKIESGTTYQKLFNTSFQYTRNMESLDDGIALLSGTGGVYLYNNGAVTNHRSRFLNYNNIYDAVKWNDKLLLATSAGIAVLERDSLVPYKLDGFDDSVFSLLVDRDNQLWIGTFNGVYKWDGQKLEQFSVAQGLIGNEVNRNALVQDSNGDIWIGTELGVSAYDEDEDMSEERDPDLYFTSILTEGGQELKTDSLPRLSANQNTLNFHFKGISYLYNDRIFYRYRLSGLEDEWNFSNNFSSPNATYRNLDSGSYTFEVQARNEVSDWSESRIFNFTIAKPFYQSWWFMLLVLMAVGLIYYLAQKLRYQYLITKQKKLKQMVEDRTRSISEKNDQIKSKNEELLQVNKQLRDKTESLNSALKKLETAQVKLVQKEKMAALGVLTAGVAHEINNPVNYIKSASELIDQMIEEENDILVIKEKDVFEEVFKSIEIGVGRIVSIVRSLSSFSRTNETDKGPCDINKIMDECLLILKNEYKGRIEMIKNYSDEPVTIQGNEGKLYQLFTNVIMNGIQAIEGVGKVHLKTWRDYEAIYVEIKDTGRGFDDSVKEKLFDPFFTTKDPGKGTGLGLSIAYNIVDEHDGEIYYDSTPGVGTRVTVKFPEKQGQ